MDTKLQLFLYGAAACGALHAVWQFHRLRGSRRWRAAEGQVLGASSERGVYGDAADFHDTVVSARIVYRFKVDGVHYTGSRVALTGDVYTDRDTRANRIMNRYRAGERVRVWYNPSDPADCCLERKADGAWFELGVSGLFAVMAKVFV